ncbi:AAA family ATPase [Anabaena cylindrica UHCC 0172]|uniref:AAA family ATPase n=1 Tax=Anabaena cylindrica TaxID=1165 RepID=UPI002B21DB26|nr:AAA family ATPase [Anabaena cylindrica]MEA5549918.1 AAA family ATPase [Anabaena cylindrica UHCC 0172]
MKIKFSNLGSIQETELDLRPLTVIIGPNNSGKTYIAYSIYGLWQRFRQILNHGKLKFKQDNEGIWSLPIDNNLLDFFIQDAEEIAKRFQGSDLEIFFQDSSHKLFSETSFLTIISRQEVEDAINKLTIKKPFDIFSLIDKNYIQIKVSRKNNTLFFKSQYKNGGKNIALAAKTLSKEYFSKFHKTDTPEIYFIEAIKKILFSSDTIPFPAERNAFINTYKILENKRYQILKKQQRELISNTSFEEVNLNKAPIIRYPQPVEDFLEFLSDIEFTKEISSNENNEFYKLADDIENQLQNKNQTYFKSTQLGGEEIKVLVKKGLEIDLYNASSSIKQLAPLLLYLRFRASKGDFLVIDEPEMNLHPESQAKLLEALSILVNLGVRVLLTTHSPYIMAHLNNLVNGNHENPEILKRQSSSLYLQDERAFLHIDKVSAYEMKDNKLVSLNDPDYGIRWDTLSDVSVDIQQKFFQIYEAGQEKADETEE